MPLNRFSLINTPARTAAIGLALTVASWLMAAAVDSIYQNHTFLEQVLDPVPGHLLFVGLQLCFVFYITRIIGKYQQQDELLAGALRDTETEKMRWQMILEAVGDPISIQDLDMKILYQNEAHKDLMGGRLGEYCYRAYRDQDQVCEGCDLAVAYQDGQRHRQETTSLTRHGLRVIEAVSTPLRDSSGKIVAGIQAMRDITERKRSELEIQRMNLELELRAEELAAANRELESFGYSLSHDLRSYITRISTAQQMLSGSDAGDPELIKYLVHSIEESCHDMEELVEAMITLSRLSTHEMRWEDVELSELVHEVLLHLQQQEMERRVDLQIARDLVVRGDRQLLKVALENLLANAWKYTRGVARPRIEFGVTDEAGKKSYYLRDNGVGFDMAERDKLFVAFQRLGTAGGFPGTGVGLATVQRAILRHGGEVWGEGAPGEGAAFYFTLPERNGA